MYTVHVSNHIYYICYLYQDIQYDRNNIFELGKNPRSRGDLIPRPTVFEPGIKGPRYVCKLQYDMGLVLGLKARGSLNLSTQN